MAISQTDKEVLIAHVIKKDRSLVMARTHHDLTREQELMLRHLVKKREQGWPLQYLTENCWFYGRQFTINDGVLIPRPETELLVEVALGHIPENESWNVFDIGCGSGVIGITLACERPLCEVHCSDPSKKAVHLTDKNARMHKCAHMIVLSQSKHLNQWGDELAEKRPCFIVANLPYLSKETFVRAPHEVKKYEPKNALLGGGNDGTKLYRRLFKEIQDADIADVRGVVIEYEPHQTKRLTAEFLKRFPTWNAIAHKDLHGDNRVLAFTPQQHRAHRH